MMFSLANFSSIADETENRSPSGAPRRVALASSTLWARGKASTAGPSVEESAQITSVAQDYRPMSPANLSTVSISLITSSRHPVKELLNTQL